MTPDTETPSTESLAAELSAMPPPPERPTPAPAPAKPISGPSRIVRQPRPEPGQPGATLRQAPAVPTRALPEAWTGPPAPTAVELRHRQRIAEARTSLQRLANSLNGGVATIAALNKALREVAGGQAEAAAAGYDLDAVDGFLSELDAVLDAHAPKKQNAEA